MQQELFRASAQQRGPFCEDVFSADEIANNISQAANIVEALQNDEAIARALIQNYDDIEDEVQLCGAISHGDTGLRKYADDNRDYRMERTQRRGSPIRPSASAGSSAPHGSEHQPAPRGSPVPHREAAPRDAAPSGTPVSPWRRGTKGLQLVRIL